MNNYYIKAFLLENCPYGALAEELLKKNNIPYKKIMINKKNSELYKSKLINTFPQLYLKKKNTSGNLLLGGYTELKTFINDFKTKTIDTVKINDFMKNTKWSKKATLRLIQLIN